MNTQQIKTAIADSKNILMSQEISLYQRNLVTESLNWLRQVETKAKQTKHGKIILVAILLDE